MPTFRIIDDFVPGTTYGLMRTLNASTNGDIPELAWFTAKTNMSDNDSMAQFKIQINTTPSEYGSIVVNADLTSVLTFIVGVSDSYNMTPYSTYFYDIKIQMSPSDYVYILESGKLLANAVITQLPSS